MSSNGNLKKLKTKKKLKRRRNVKVRRKTRRKSRSKKNKWKSQKKINHKRAKLTCRTTRKKMTNNFRLKVMMLVKTQIRTSMSSIGGLVLSKMVWVHSLTQQNLRRR